MIAFLVNGDFLDLYETTTFQVSRKNSIFAFDSMEVTRSASFDIPATPKNNRILQIANSPAQLGTMARTKIATEMQYSGGVETGYLYITKATETKYTVMFTYGELLTLKTLRENKVTSPGGTCLWGDSSQVWNADAAYADDSKGGVFGIVKYKPVDTTQMSYWGNGLQPFPSLQLYRLLYQSMYDLGIYLTVTDLSLDDVTNYRLVPPKLVWYDSNTGIYHEDFASVYGKTLRAQDNIPDVEIVKLLKTFALLTNSAIRLTDSTHVALKPVNFNSWNVVALDKLVEFGEIKRTFGDYAQSNTITFEGGSDALPYGLSPYTIPNANLAEEKTMLSVPLSHGDTVSVVENGITYINAAVDNFLLRTTSTPPVVANDSEFTGDKWTIVSLVNSFYGSTSNTAKYMMPAKAYRMTWLANLMTTSTSIKVSCIMTMSEFNALAEDKLYDVNGLYYVWTGGTWQDGIATLELSKVTI